MLPIKEIKTRERDIIKVKSKKKMFLFCSFEIGKICIYVYYTHTKGTFQVNMWMLLCAFILILFSKLSCVSGDFRFVDSSTSAEKGIIINVAEYDSTFANAITDSSTTDTTSLTGQYFKVTVASDFGIISTDTNNFEVFADSTDPIISISTSEPYTTTNTIAVKVEDSTARPIVTDIEIDNTNTIQNAVFGINITFIEEVSGVDIADFRFVESSTDTEKGSIINVAEYTDGNFDTPITDSSTTDTTSLTGQYFKVTVASDFGIESADSNSFEILVDSTDPIRSTATYFSYITTTDIIAVTVDSTTRPTVSSIAIDNDDETQAASFGVNVAFSEEVSGVDIGDFRFVESGTDTKKGHVINITEYTSDTFGSSIADSSTINSITTLTGQYFKVTVAANSEVLSTDSNSFEVVVDTATPVRSTATYFPYTTTNTLAVEVDSTASTPVISFDGETINNGGTIYINQDKISLTASSLETGATLHVTKGEHITGLVNGSNKNLIQVDKNTLRFAGRKDVYGTGAIDTSVKFSTTDAFHDLRSIAFWADPDNDIDTTGQRWVNIAVARTGATRSDITTGRDGDTNGLYFSTRFTSGTPKYFNYSASGYSFFDRHHYVFVFSSDGWKLYIDGTEVDPTNTRPSGTGSLPDSSIYDSPFLGKRGPGLNNNYYTGDLQNIIISRSVFSSSIVDDLYSGGAVLDDAPDSVLNDNLIHARAINTTPSTLVEDITITDASHNTADIDLNINDDTNIFVRQIDAFGNESNSVRIVVTHDSENPSVPTLAFTAENIPGDNVITVTGAESDATVTVTATNGTETVTNTREGNGDVILNLTTLGDWNITAFQTDLAENDSASSVSATLKISILAPKLIVNPSYATEIITIEVSDAVQTSTVTVTATSSGGTEVIRTRVGNGNITLELSFGRWTLKVKQSSSGVDSPDSEEYSILLDEHAPTISTLELDTTGTKSTEFDVKVAFNEDVKNVDISDFVLQDSSDNVKAQIIKVTAYPDDTFDPSKAGVYTSGTQPISGQYFLVSVLPYKNESSQTLTFKILEDTNTDDAIADLVDQPVDRSVGTDEISVTIDTTVPATPTLTFGGVTYASGDTIYTRESQISLDVSSLVSNAQTINIGSTGHLPSNKITGTLNDVPETDDPIFSFNGSSSYVSFPTYNFGDLRSVSFWADPDDTSSTSNQRIFNLALSAFANTTFDVSVSRNGNTKGIALKVQRNVNSAQEDYTANYTSDSFSYFDRNHYVVVFHSTGWKLYINGVEATLSSVQTARPSDAVEYNYAFIGRYATETGTPKEYYKGDIQNIIFSEQHFNQVRMLMICITVVTQGTTYQLVSLVIT